MQPVAPAHRIRSFKPRRGRVTPGQQRALDALGGTYALPLRDTPLDPVEVYGRSAPLILEIGFGMGETTATLAEADPARDVLAVDVHTPGIGALLAEVAARGLSNVRVISGDAVEVLRDMLAPSSLDEVRVFFPDPWPKSRHHKRRLVDAGFAALAATRLRPGGRVHCATDWAPYARQMLAALSATPELQVLGDGFVPRPGWRPVTRFEQQGIDKGHEVFDVIAVRAG
ncbi:tRNA (guanosine(46)-N7)-methyltransferase TrmB [Motilibacter aurantiacus]|uniref:tRNA (guanosine(46)-N7)-methyltransferase TrmB n=1 Tax=Motilibacter aurantiacus TaxID=2714955 RepID=UPI002F2B2BAD